MQTEEAREQETAEGQERVIDASGNERRRALRRKLPFGRGAVLGGGERAHIVGVADVSVTGAYLTTRAPVARGETHALRLMLLPETAELELRAEIVRVAQTDPESPDHPRGVAVRFSELSEKAAGQLQAFIARGQVAK